MDQDRRDNSIVDDFVVAAVDFQIDDDDDVTTCYYGDDDDDDDDHYDLWLDPDPRDIAESMMRRLRANHNNNPLRHLELEDGCLTEWFQEDMDGRVEDFLHAIRCNTTVSQVSISGEFLKEMAALWTEFARVDDTMEDYHVGLFEWMLLDAISQLPALKTLVLQEVIDFDGYTLPVDFLQHVLQQAAKLETLTLRFVELAHPVTPSEEDDLDASLASLHRDDENSATNRTLFRAFRNHPSLREVTLTQLRLEDEVGLNPLIRGLASIPNLQSVKLHMSRQRQQERRHIRVDQDDNSTSVQAAASLKPLALCESLWDLELSSLCIRDEAKLLQALHNHTSLKHLSLANTELSFSGWASLAQMLQRGKRQEPLCVSLERLQLDNMSGLDDSTLQLLSRALGSSSGSHHTPTLKDLRLLNVMDMGRVGWKAIADMIATNRSLESLSLENCQGMDDDAVVGVAKALEHNTTLRQLELQVFAGHCTRFSQKVGQKAFVEVLRSGKNITLVNLYTQAKEELETQLEYYLNLNRTGLRPYLLEKQSGESSPSDFWKLLEVHRFDLDILFYAMTTNPPFVLSCLQAL